MPRRVRSNRPRRPRSRNHSSESLDRLEIGDAAARLSSAAQHLCDLRRSEALALEPASQLLVSVLRPQCFELGERAVYSVVVALELVNHFASEIAVDAMA